jgi:hypothetical protein
MRLQRQQVIAGEEIGLETVEPPPAPKPIKIILIGPPSAAPLVNPLASPPDRFSKRLPLPATIDQFVRETTLTRNPKTGSDYRFKLAYFGPLSGYPRKRLDNAPSTASQRPFGGPVRSLVG